jgi:hypothetical protein
MSGGPRGSRKSQIGPREQALQVRLPAFSKKDVIAEGICPSHVSDTEDKPMSIQYAKRVNDLLADRSDQGCHLPSESGIRLSSQP